MPNAFGQFAKASPHSKFYNLSTVYMSIIASFIHACMNQAEAPAEMFSGGGQSTYSLSTGSIKTLQLQPGFC